MRFVTYLLAVVLGVLLGLGGAYWLIERANSIAVAEAGGWAINLKAGSCQSDPLSRAMVARHGLLALSKEETIYFIRAADDAGAPFDPACAYRVEGRDPPARWWSVTLYDERGYLAQNADAAHAVDASRMVRAADGAWEVRIGPDRAGAANWLSTNAAGRFSLLLRLYNPDPALLADPRAAPLPQIVRGPCSSGGAS